MFKTASSPLTVPSGYLQACKACPLSRQTGAGHTSCPSLKLSRKGSANTTLGICRPASPAVLALNEYRRALALPAKTCLVARAARLIVVGFRSLSYC